MNLRATARHAGPDRSITARFGLAAGHPLLQTVQIGSYVFAYAATKLGAQSAYGTADEVIAYFS